MSANGDLTGLAATSDEGRLVETPLPQLLLALYLRRASGQLVLERDRTTKHIAIHNGAPFDAESNLPREQLIAQLERDGAIDADAAVRARQIVDDKGCKERAAIAALKLLEAKALYVAMRESMRRRVIDCFGWPDGNYRFTPSEGEPDKATAAMRLDPLALVQSGLEAHWSPERMLGALQPLANLKPAASEALAHAVRRLAGKPVLVPLSARLDGSVMLGQILPEAMSDTASLAGLWVLAGAGLLAEDATATGGEASEPEYDIEISITGAGTAQRAAFATSGANAGPKDADKAAAIRKELTEAHERLDEMDHYELLGLSKDVASGSIRKAYFKAAKRYHPDALSRLGLDDIKPVAAEVFGRIAEANAVLTDDEQRERYDKDQASGGLTVDVNRIAQAEAFYLKGEVLARMGNFREALELLENAVAVYPDECEYQSTLGWALYKLSESSRARKHLEQAIALKSDHAQSHFRLGHLLKSIGDNEGAAAAIATARSIDPTVKGI